MAGRVGSTFQSSAAVTCMKTMLMVFNFVFWISGIAVLALGIWMKVQLHIYVELTTMYYNETPYVLMGVGGGIILVGTLGCCCTVKGKSAFLYMYAAFLVLVFVVELSVAIAAFVYRGKLEEGFNEGLTNALKEYEEDDEKTKAINDIQEGLHCCGKDKYSDWFEVPYGKDDNRVPESCCIDKNDCKPTNLPPAGSNVTGIYVEGCYTKVTTFMEKNFGIIGGVAVGFAFIQLLGALLSCGLAKNINKAKYEQVA